MGDGSIASSMSVTSPGASDIRVALQVELVPGGEIRFFGTDTEQALSVRTGAALVTPKGDKPDILWSPVVEGDTIGLEIVLPSPNALSSFSLKVETVSHGYHDEYGQPGIVPKTLECPNHHIDVACRVGAYPTDQENAVALIRFDEAGLGGFVCSGTLLNAAATFIPYVLTAHHCISTQAVADTAVAWWFYKRDACGSSATPTYRITDEDVGAERLATSAEQDSTLLRFRGRIPSGLTFSGYTNRNIPAPDKPDNFFEDLFDPGLHATIPAYGLHHPDGGVMKYSRGSIVFQDDTSAEGQTVIDAYHVKWGQGATEPGSSGSGLFIGNQLIGVNFSWNTQCGSWAWYGAFQHFWPRARRWLAPTAATHVSIPSSTPEHVDSSGVDYFRFDLSRGAKLRVETTGPTDTVGTLFELKGQVASDDDGGDGLNFRIVKDVLPGIYHLVVRGFDESTSGPYTLEVHVEEVVDDHGGTPGEATLVAIPSTTLGRLDPPGEADYFRIEPQQDGMLQVETTGGIDTLGQFGGSGIDIEDDNSGAGANFRIVAEVQAGATYFLLVQGPYGSTEVGDYLLHVEFLGAPVPEPDHVLPLIMAAGGQLQGFVRIHQPIRPSRNGRHLRGRRLRPTLRSRTSLTECPGSGPLQLRRSGERQPGKRAAVGRREG